MGLDVRAKYKSEMSFFKNVQKYYNSKLDACGDIQNSLSHLKKKLDQSRNKLSPDKWARLDNALRTGEITRGKKSTPGDWAASELRLCKASLAASRKQPS